MARVKAVEQTLSSKFFCIIMRETHIHTFLGNSLHLLDEIVIYALHWSHYLLPINKCIAENANLEFRYYLKFNH